MKAKDVWTEQDQRVALTQGWGLFSVSRSEPDEHWEIRRFDEADTFASDHDAVVHLIRMSGRHRPRIACLSMKALMLHQVQLEQEVFVGDYP